MRAWLVPKLQRHDATRYDNSIMLRSMTGYVDLTSPTQGTYTALCSRVAAGCFAVEFRQRGWCIPEYAMKASEVGTIPIFTIGYGHRSSNEFLALLRQYQIRYVIDVRSRPYSKFNPSFSQSALERWLKENGVLYVPMGHVLGGKPEDKTCYTEDGKVDYSKYRSTAAFQSGLGRLRRAWQQQHRVVLMCSEAKPQECHRAKLIGEALVEDNMGVVHIDEAGTLRSHHDVMAAIPYNERPQLTLFGPTSFTSRKSYRDMTEPRANSSTDVDATTEKPTFVTMGVYGFSEDKFICALHTAHIDTFCDIRARRGMRGSEYAFANSTALQLKLRELGIRYIHAKQLAPTQAIRSMQSEIDASRHVAKRAREELSAAFIQSYELTCLRDFDTHNFLAELGSSARRVALFCVERKPSACHRSIVAQRLRGEGFKVEDVTA